MVGILSEEFVCSEKERLIIKSNKVLKLFMKCFKSNVIQGRHGEFESGKVQYSTPNFFDYLVVSYKGVLKPKI